MRKYLSLLILCVLCVLLSGCGNTSTQNELTGQAKKVIHHTPLVCPAWDELDVSLGIMRNGVGSMSTQDLFLYVPDLRDLEILKKAVELGSIVKVTYDVRRVTICVTEGLVRKVEIVE